MLAKFELVVKNEADLDQVIAKTRCSESWLLYHFCVRWPHEIEWPFNPPPKTHPQYRKDTEPLYHYFLYSLVSPFFTCRIKSVINYLLGAEVSGQLITTGVCANL